MKRSQSMTKVAFAGDQGRAEELDTAGGP